MRSEPGAVVTGFSFAALPLDVNEHITRKPLATASGSDIVAITLSCLKDATRCAREPVTSFPVLTSFAKIALLLKIASSISPPITLKS